MDTRIDIYKYTASNGYGDIIVLYNSYGTFIFGIRRNFKNLSLRVLWDIPPMRSIVTDNAISNFIGPYVDGKPKISKHDISFIGEYYKEKLLIALSVVGKTKTITDIEKDYINEIVNVLVYYNNDMIPASLSKLNKMYNKLK